MYNYKGISMDTLTLLELNRFNNSKEFYDEHKKEMVESDSIREENNRDQEDGAEGN